VKGSNGPFMSNGIRELRNHRLQFDASFLLKARINP
jgi:hypothetical protein